MDGLIFLQSFLILFAIVNPIGSIPIFLQLTYPLKPQERKRAFDTGVLSSFVILLLFMFAGQTILTHFFQIEAFDLMAAGGLLLIIIAVDHLVFGSLVRNVLNQEQDAAHLGAVPIACPILAGPGALMTVLVLYSKNGLATTAGAIILVMGVTWLIMRFIDTIYSFLGKIVCIVLSKILSLFIAAIGMRLLITGLKHYF